MRRMCMRQAAPDVGRLSRTLAACPTCSTLLNIFLSVCRAPRRRTSIPDVDRPLSSSSVVVERAMFLDVCLAAAGDTKDIFSECTTHVYIPVPFTSHILCIYTTSCKLLHPPKCRFARSLASLSFRMLLLLLCCRHVARHYELSQTTTNNRFVV